MSLENFLYLSVFIVSSIFAYGLYSALYKSNISPVYEESWFKSTWSRYVLAGILIGSYLLAYQFLDLTWLVVIFGPFFIGAMFMDWFHYRWHLNNTLSKYIIDTHMRHVTNWWKFERELKKGATYADCLGIYSLYHMGNTRKDWNDVVQVKAWYDWEKDRDEKLGITFSDGEYVYFRDKDIFFHQFMRIFIEKHPELKPAWEKRNIMDGEVVIYEK